MTNKKIIRVNMGILSAVIIEAINNNTDVNITVTGDSMYPVFRNGVDSVLLTRPIVLKKYDIPLYKREDGDYVLHRIIKIKNDCLYLAGDNQTDIEFPVYEKQVLALVKGFYRNGKYITCDNILYKLYSAFWVLILPFRKHLLKILKKAQSTFCGLRRKLRDK